MATEDEFCLKWNNHHNILLSVFNSLVNTDKFTDCSLFAEGKEIKAHRVLLSACSPYFEALFMAQAENKYPILIFTEVSYEEIYCILEYVYKGEVSVAQAKLNSFLKAAEALRIKGLTENEDENPVQVPAPIRIKPNPVVPTLPEPHRERSRVKRQRSSNKPPDSSFISSSSNVKTEVHDLTMEDDFDDRMTEGFGTPPDSRCMEDLSQDGGGINNDSNAPHDTYDNLPDPPGRDEQLADQNQESPGSRANTQGSHQRNSTKSLVIHRRVLRSEVLKPLNHCRRSFKSKVTESSSNIQRVKSNAHMIKFDELFQEAIQVDIRGSQDLQIKMQRHKENL